jgi:hypothetical protein
MRRLPRTELTPKGEIFRFIMGSYNVQSHFIFDWSNESIGPALRRCVIYAGEWPGLRAGRAQKVMRTALHDPGAASILIRLICDRR